MSNPRETVRALASGQGGGTLAVPLALHVSARIQERDAEDFLYDATQLANALRDLIDAISPDGVPVCSAEVLLTDCNTTERVLTSEQLQAATEATRRLRTSFGDRIALVAAIPGPAAIAETTHCDAPAAAETTLILGKEFLAAGADVILVEDDSELPGAPLSTLANVARFHQAIALSYPADRYGLTAATAVSLETPAASAGVVVTPESLERKTDIGVLREWVDVVRG